MFRNQTQVDTWKRYLDQKTAVEGEADSQGAAGSEVQYV